MLETVKLKKPVIFEYTNYRLYLKDLYHFYKENYSYFSYRYFSKHAGFKSPNYLKLVINGTRNLTKDSIPKFSNSLKLNKSESVFFEKLVYYNQAISKFDKSQLALDMVQSKICQQLKPLDVEKLRFYSYWFCIGIRELTLCNHFKYDTQWIAQQFIPALDPKDVQKGLDTLTRLGFIKLVNGKVIVSEKNISTGNEIANSLIYNYHKKMIEMGRNSLELFASHEREVSSVSMPISQESFKKIKEKIQIFRKEIMAIVETDKNPDQVYQFNFQLFPLTKGAKQDD